MRNRERACYYTAPQGMHNPAGRTGIGDGVCWGRWRCLSVSLSLLPHQLSHAKDELDCGRSLAYDPKRLHRRLAHQHVRLLCLALLLGDATPWRHHRDVALVIATSACSCSVACPRSVRGRAILERRPFANVARLLAAPSNIFIDHHLEALHIRLRRQPRRAVHVTVHPASP